MKSSACNDTHTYVVSLQHVDLEGGDSPNALMHVLYATMAAYVMRGLANVSVH